MPTYEFECQKCNYRFSDLLKMSDRHLPLENACPNCKEEKCIISVISAPAVVSPFSVDGLKKPRSDFKERMQQIKQGLHGTAKIKDY